MAKLDPAQVAFWRYEKIQEALSEDLHPTVRGQILRQVSKAPVRWPNGATKSIALATLYRWLERYQKGGLEALRPRPRCDRGKPRRRLANEVIEEALRLLREDEGATYTFVLVVLRAKFPQHQISRSTLQRRLSARPEYARIKAAHKRARRRGRFVAKKPHDIWHTDIKGPVRVRLRCGAELVFYIISVLDDATRAVLVALIVKSPDLGAAVRAFRLAALRWGLPSRLYADRASIFDSIAFRTALAMLGAHRIETKARNPEAHGKIEAYHRTLVLWFVDRLGRQVVVDLPHLQQLLDGVIATLYQPHRHRGLKCSPEQALDGRVSARSVPPTRLYEAFRQERRLKAHRKTGEVDIAGATYLVPDELRGHKLTFLVDPPGEVPPVVVDPHSGKERELRRAAIRPEDVAERADEARAERWGPGALQTLYDSWQTASPTGSPKRRPQAEPGFGLPEIYALLGRAAGRHVPRSDHEAALIQRIYRDAGPFGRAATEAALLGIAQKLGPDRPIKAYLDALCRLAARNDAQAKEPQP